MAVTATPIPGSDLPATTTRQALVASYEHQLLLYVRTWRGSIFANFAQPVLLLVAMGIGLTGPGLLLRRAGRLSGRSAGDGPFTGT